jgi:hypothetical protein
MHKRTEKCKFSDSEIPLRKKPRGRPRLRWKNIKMALRDKGHEYVELDGTGLVGSNGREFVNIFMITSFPHLSLLICHIFT